MTLPFNKWQGQTVSYNFTGPCSAVGSAFTREPDVWVQYSVPPHTLVSSSTDSRWVVVTYRRKYVHEVHVLVNCLGGLRVGRKTLRKWTQLSSRSHPRHLTGNRTAQKDTITDITSDSQVNSNFPYRWSPASSLTINNYFYLFLCPRRNFGWHIKIAPSVRQLQIMSQR